MKEYVIVCLLLFSCGVKAQQTEDFSAPVYADPFYCGSCDPEIVWNPAVGEWFFFYTSRRPALGVAATCGNPIGVAVSKDFKNWRFKGYCLFDGKGGERTVNIYFGLRESLLMKMRLICLLRIKKMLRHYGG